MGNIILKITALVCAMALWFYVISLKDFQLTMEVPLTFVKLPEALAIASKPPSTVSVTVEGKPWTLSACSRKSRQQWSSTCTSPNSAPSASTSTRRTL